MGCLSIQLFTNTFPGGGGCKFELFGVYVCVSDGYLSLRALQVLYGEDAQVLERPKSRNADRP